MFPSAPTPVTPVPPVYAYPDALQRFYLFPQPSVSVLCLTLPCHPATYPASPLLCRWLPPQSQQTCPPGQSPNQDPMPALSGLRPLGSPGPQKDWEKEGLCINVRKCTCQNHPSSLLSDLQGVTSVLAARDTDRKTQTGRGHCAYLRGTA